MGAGHGQRVLRLSCLGVPGLLTGGHLSVMPSTLTAATAPQSPCRRSRFRAWLIAAGAVNWLLGLEIIILLRRRAA